MKEYKDREILEGIKRHNHKIINFIYDNVLPIIENMIVNSGGNISHAKDIFQDAMIIVYRKIRNEGLWLNCKFSTYMYSICRNLWLQELKHGDKVSKNSIHLIDIVNEPDAESDYRNEIHRIFDTHFQSLSPDCQKILNLHFSKISIEDIRKLMGHSNSHYTIDRKYRCKQSLVKRIMNDPRYKEIENGFKDENR